MKARCGPCAKNHFDFFVMDNVIEIGGIGLTITTAAFALLSNSVEDVRLK
jgi:hypothetical protein